MDTAPLPTPLPFGAFTIADLLSAHECAELMDLATQQGFAPAGVRTAGGERSMPAIRNNERLVARSPRWVGLLWQRLRGAGLPEIDGERAQGLPQDLRFYRYTTGQRFKMHKDGPWHEAGLASKLTLLVYLNEGFAGGATAFRGFSVQPRTGMALLFPHATWHEGEAVAAGEKLVLRSDVMYAPVPVGQR